MAVEAEKRRQAEAAEAAALQRAEAEKLAKESKERALQKSKASGSRSCLSNTASFPYFTISYRLLNLNQVQRQKYPKVVQTLRT